MPSCEASFSLIEFRVSRQSAVPEEEHCEGWWLDPRIAKTQPNRIETGYRQATFFMEGFLFAPFVSNNLSNGPVLLLASRPSPLGIQKFVTESINDPDIYLFRGSRLNFRLNVLLLHGHNSDSRRWYPRFFFVSLLDMSRTIGSWTLRHSPTRGADGKMTTKCKPIKIWSPSNVVAQVDITYSTTGSWILIFSMPLDKTMSSSL